ncbi:MAG: PQQ-dependent sugar dehydrogenase [Geminicoccaceae bacterium]|nr:PQQ-dependent sugar dehydrogenase [Geminicoccaceae bacterium]
MKCLVAFLAAMSSFASLAVAEDYDTSAGPVRVEPMLEGLEEPWSLAFLPDGDWLVTERDGRLLLVGEGQAREVAGVPQVVAVGQGGLLDVVVARDFGQSRRIFLSYAEPAADGARTALATGFLDPEEPRIDQLQVIFRMSAASASGHHFGSRIVEAPDGTLFLTIGERGHATLAQDLDVDNGKVVRINPDGSIPADNPFAGGGGRPEIWSYGHRNPQGAALDEEGRLWTVEHGARGGDEINRPEPGRNYGWPVISYGRDYSGAKIGIGTEAPGMEQPLFYWDPSIAPSGMMICSCRMFPQWQGNVFVGSLKFDMISRLERDGDRIREAERLFDGTFGRIRDVREAPDGSIWFLSVVEGAAYRITPAGG